MMKGLALNGGGAKGLSVLQMLKKLEDKVGTLHEYFYAVSGTSTGSIIAAAISVGISISDIEKMYIEKLPLIFKKPWYRFGIFKTKYSNEELKKALIEVFGNLRMKDCMCEILLPTLNADTDRVKIFKRKDDVFIWQAVLASSSAPTYFPMTEIDGEWYKDGGLSHNNPSDILFKEFLANDYKRPLIYNFSTGCIKGISNHKERNYGLSYNVAQTIEDMFLQQDLKVVGEMEYLAKNEKCYFYRNDVIINKSSGKISDVSPSNMKAMVEDGKNSAVNFK